MDIRIETTRLILRPFTDSDAAAVKHFTENEFETELAALEWIHWINEIPGKRPDTHRLLIMFAVELKQTGECIGRVYIHSKIELNGEVEIGYCISKEHRNMGYATEAAKAAVWFAFERAEQDVLSAIVKPENIASRRVIEKLGFVSGGVRPVLDDDGEYYDFDYFRLYHTDYLPCPEWVVHDLYKPERMSDFFKNRADGYNDHMLSDGGEERYRKLGEVLPKTDGAVRILDLGCGTGIELDYIWERTPNAHITCVDLSSDMLALLVKNHPNRLDKITTINMSYLEWDYPREAFDFAVSIQTMHHFFSEKKSRIYRSIHKALKSGGCYIESDFYVDTIAMEQYRRRYKTILSQVPERAEAGKYHIDIPNTIDIQRQLLSDAGFQTVEVLESHIRPRWSGGILKAGK